jgi:hypothetical protein
MHHPPTAWKITAVRICYETFGVGCEFYPKSSVGNLSPFEPHTNRKAESCDSASGSGNVHE